MRELLAEAGRRQADEVLLEVRIDNPAARALYEKLEFTVIGTDAATSITAGWMRW